MTAPTPWPWRSIPPRAPTIWSRRGTSSRWWPRTAASWSAPAISPRLAGLNPAGVICEVMKDDGTMARLPDLVAFAQLHGMKIGTIADLIAYRRRTERQVERVLETPFESVYGGHFRMVIYRNVIDRTEHVVLIKGKVDSDRPTLVRMHKVDMAA